MHVKHRMARCQESQPWWSYRAKSEENCHVPVRVTARLLHSQLAAALRMSFRGRGELVCMGVHFAHNKGA